MLFGRFFEFEPNMKSELSVFLASASCCTKQIARITSGHPQFHGPNLLAKRYLTSIALLTTAFEGLQIDMA